MRTFKIGAFTLALLFGGLLAVPEAQTTIRRGFSQAFFGDGSAASPSVSFASQTGTGWFYGGDGKVGLSLGSGTTPMILFGGTTSSFPALKRSAAIVQVKLADDSAFAQLQADYLNVNGGYLIAGKQFVAVAAPTVSSGFGTSPSIVANNGTAAFTVNVGTGGVATSGVIGLPAATTGWNCFVIDRTTNVVTRETATTTTSATLTAASAWAASDILQVSCFAY